MDFTARYYQLKEVDLHVIEAGPPEGPLLLFMHGFPEFWYGWHKQIPFFAALGYRVVAPDLRGYNLSSKPAGIKAYTSSRHVEDIVQLIQALGRQKATLVGHDWGGVVAWHFAIKHPSLLEKLVVMNIPHPAIMRKTLKKSIRQMLKSWYAGFFQLPFLPEFLIKGTSYHMLSNSIVASSRRGTFTEKDLARYRTAWRQPGSLTAMLNWYRAARHSQQELKHPQPISTPTLLLWGKNDRFLNKEMATESIALCPSGKLLFLNRATHWLHHEEPDTVNKLILEFIGPL